MKKITPALTAWAAFIVLGVGVSPSANSATWTITTIGTIYDGYDTTGVFGTANTDLTGMTFSQVISLDPTAYATQYTDSYVNYGSYALSGNATDTVTVNGVTQTFTWDLANNIFGDNYGVSYLQNSLTQGAEPYDEVYQYQSGHTADRSTLIAANTLYSSTNAFNHGLNFDQVWSRNVQPGDIGWAYFDLSGNSGTAYIRGFPMSLSINEPISPVPEPATYTMLLAGLGLIGFTTWRRKEYNV